MATDTLRRGALAALAALVSMVLASGPAQALDLVRVWRINGSDTAVQVFKQDVPGLDRFFHGTYRSDPYLAISHGEKGELRLFSDGMLRARLVPVAGSDSDFDAIELKTGARLATLRGKDPRCAGRPSCIAFDGVTKDAGLSADPSVIYVPMLKKIGAADEATSHRQRYGDMFTPLAHDWATVLNCYYIADLDIWTTNDTGNCRQALFAEPGAESLDYAKVTPVEGGPIAVPFGWIYQVVSEAKQNEQSRLIESSVELSQAEQSILGFNVGINLFVVDTSVHYRKTDRTRSDQLQQQKTRLAQSDYLRNDWAMVLDKGNAFLTSYFLSELETLRVSRNFDYFVGEFGTHYPFATTFGGRGQRQASMSDAQVATLAETGVDVAMGSSVELSIPTEGGNVGASGGVDGGNSKDMSNRMNSVLGSESIRSQCMPGSGCVDGRPGTGSVPVQWDLRPLSDLLAPPFFTDEDTVVGLRDGVMAAIVKKLALVPDAQGVPGARFARINGVSNSGQPRSQCGERDDAAPETRNRCCGLVGNVITTATLKGASQPLNAADNGEWFPRQGLVRSVSGMNGLFDSVTLSYLMDRGTSEFSSAPLPGPRNLHAAPNQPLLDQNSRQPITAFATQPTAAVLPMAWDDATCNGVSFELLLTVKGLSAKELLGYSGRQLLRWGK